MRIGTDSVSRDGPDMPYLYSNSEQLDLFMGQEYQS